MLGSRGSLRRTLSFAAALALYGCGAPSHPLGVRAYPPPDPRVVALLEQSDRTLREARAALERSEPDGLVAVGRARMALAASADELERTHGPLLARVVQARRALEALAGSERERTQVLRAELELAEGRAPTAALPSDVRDHAAFRELVDAHAALSRYEGASRALRAKEAALDSVLAWLLLGASPRPTGSARDIGPDLGP